MTTTDPVTGPQDAPRRERSRPPARTAEPTPRRTPDQTRALILDAAAECLVEGGFANGRLLTAIARKAGISRPTLYKYGGNVDDIRRDLVHREVTAFAHELLPRLRTLTWSGDDLLDVLVFGAGYAHAHPLLQAALRDIPDVILPVFTINADDTIAWIVDLVTPLAREHMDAGRLPPFDIPVLVEALFRIAVSLFLVRGRLDLDDPGALRRYLDGALHLLADLRTTTPI